MIDSLDPHSEFMDPEEYQELQSDTEGEFGGLGLVVTMKDNYVTVVTPMDDTPGFRAGILAGDRIVKINGRSADKMSLPDAVKLLRGEPGTQVTVTIQRPSSGVTRDFTLTRAIINVDMVKDINGKKDFPLGAGQDRLHPHHAVWRQHQRRTGRRAEKVEGGGHEGVDSRFARESRRLAGRGGGGLQQIPAARTTRCHHRRARSRRRIRRGARTATAMN